MHRKISFALAGLAAILMAALSATPAHAGMVLTPAGTAAGFSLSDYADGFPSTGYCCGPLGIAVNSDGNVMVQSWGDGTIKVFADVDGQNASSPISSVPFATCCYGSAFTNDNGIVYSTRASDTAIVQLNNDGTVNQVIVTGPGKGGIWTDPTNGHLISAGYGAIYDTDPIAKTTHVIVNADVDGISVSPDGKTVYGAAGGFVWGWSIATGAQVFQSAFIGSPDGTAVIQGSSGLAGSIISNNNDGTVDLIDPVSGTLTVIATGGSRGDFVGLDSTNGSLFLSQTDNVMRLSCGPDCFFTPPPPGVPEPSTAGLCFGGLLLAGWRTWRRRA
jgi:hypothetical protein